MSKFNKGDSVTLVRCADRFMQADRRNLGKTGTISEVIRDGSLVYAEVQLNTGGIEHVEAQGMSITKRAARVSTKREEFA